MPAWRCGELRLSLCCGFGVLSAAGCQTGALAGERQCECGAAERVAWVLCDA